MRVLVFHSWGMGDLIMATPMLQSLHLSGHQVDLVVTSELNKTILKENRFLNNIYLIKNYLELFKFYKKYDVLAATAGINPKKVFLLNLSVRAKHVFATKQKKSVHRIDVNIENVKAILTEIRKEPYIYLEHNENILKKYFSNCKNIGFAVGSGKRQSFKRMDIAKYVELIKKIDGNKLIFIGQDELELKKELEGLNVKIVSENIENTIAIISRLDMLIGNDNGLMQIGYATKTKTITIFGMTNEKETGGYFEQNKSFFLDMPCRPCFDSSNDRLKCSEIRCLKDISVEKIYELYCNLLQQK